MKEQQGLISKAVEDFYNNSSEEDRLTIGLGPLEFERNKELIGRYLKKKSMIVIDVGGGTGKYSEWLAGLGHEVWMIDPMEKHIKQAARRAAKKDNHFKVILGEARQLDFNDNFADLVILHGPLYHLPDKDERMKAISEAVRITKSGGIILGFAISYTASTLVALLQGVIHMQDIFEMCRSELTSGNHEAPENMPGVLSEAYYHRPEELVDEFTEARLTEINLFAVEGITWLDKDFFTSRSDKVKKQNLTEINHLTENDRNLVAFSPHIMVSSKKNI